MPEEGPKSGAPGTGRATTEQGKTRDHRVEKRPPDRLRGELAAAPAFIADEVTGQYTGEELRAVRGKRTTSERLDRLEVKHDDLKKDFGDRLGRVEVAVADMGGQFKVIPSLIETMQSATQAMQQREHVTFTAKVDIDKAQAIGEAEVGKAQAIGEVEIKKAKWQLILKVSAIVGGIVTAIAAAFAAGRC